MTASSTRATLPLHGIRVIETGSLPAAAYCARLFADFGAEVLKLEPPGGDPARQALPRIDIGSGSEESAEFSYLNFNKQSLTGSRERLHALLAGADVLVDGMSAAERRAAGVDHAALQKNHPQLVIADVSWFGSSGPYRDYQGSDAVCRALAGLVKLVGPIEGPPLALADYQASIIGGLSAFIPVMASLLARLDGARGRSIEVSVHESAVALAELDLSRLAPGYVERRAGINLFTAGGTLGIFRCKVGWLGMTFNSPAQWKSFCNMAGMPELGEDQNYYISVERAKRARELEQRLSPVFMQRTAREWLEEALRLKLPFAVVPEMSEVLALDIFQQRGAIVEVKTGTQTVRAPGNPLRLGLTPPQAGGRVPRPGEQDSAAIQGKTPDSFAPLKADAATRLPLAGMRVIDLSMGWAGPLATRMMADLGADIIKVEACKYPDWWRGQERHAAMFEQTLYEKTQRFNYMNRGKRGITLDLTTPEGARLVKQLVAGADAVIENNSAGVLPKLGLDYPRLIEVNPSLVMLSMNAFGSGTAWSELRAYGSTLEHACGLPTVSGPEGTPPTQNHVAYGDAISGLNACSALLTALLHRKRTGQGQFIDLGQVECMLTLCAPWVIEQSARGKVGPRLGNRHPMHAPHGVFRCAGADEWVLIAVTSDAMWPALCKVAGLDRLAADASLAQAAGRRQRQDDIEAALSAWTGTRSKDEVMTLLQQAGVAAGAVLSPGELIEDRHLKARGFWQYIDRPFIGVHPQASAPFREGGKPYPVPHAAPTLGQYNAEVLGGVLGLSAEAQAELAARNIIGTKLLRSKGAPAD